jgi:hypothetical protein
VFLPGQGVGPIRFGATVATIERHMDASCDQISEDRCLFVRQAIEFFLEDGKLVRLKAHRRDRVVKNPPKEGDQYFGTLRGLLFPKIMLGLHRHVVEEEFGAPHKKEPKDPPGADGLVDRHYYDGVTLEFDQIENGNIVLSAIEVFPSETAAAEHKKRLRLSAEAAAEAAANAPVDPGAPKSPTPIPPSQRAK